MSKMDEVLHRIREVLVLMQNALESPDMVVFKRYYSEYKKLRMEFDEAVEKEEYVDFNDWKEKNIIKNRGAVARIAEHMNHSPSTIHRLLDVGEGSRLSSLKEIYVLSGGKIKGILDFLDEDERQRLMDEAEKVRKGEIQF